MVVVDEAFKNAGKTKGVEIWRIKAFTVIPMEKSEYGQFYSGDSYIILMTEQVGQAVFHYAHYWLGSDVTQDEAGTAAIKTVELDESLGGGPVQFREVQGHESAQFMSYFKNGVKYLKGGFESGFHRIGDEVFTPRLFQCKGKRNVHLKQVDLNIKSLNKGDVFILETEEDIYVWMPPKSGRLERVKGIQHANNIRDSERAGRGDIHVLDSDWYSNAGFWKIMGGDFEQVKDATRSVDRFA